MVLIYETHLSEPYSKRSIKDVDAYSQTKHSNVECIRLILLKVLYVSEDGGRDVLFPLN